MQRHVRQAARKFLDIAMRAAGRSTLIWSGHKALATAHGRHAPRAFPAPVLIGTFHKSGTVLMKKIVTSLCEHTGSGFWHSNRSATAPGDWQVCFNYDCSFKDLGINPAEYPTVIIIRDPRDLIVSGMNYHLKSSERWLTEPDPCFDGRSYQETLTAIEDRQERYRFELRNRAATEIRRMVAIRTDPDYGNALFVKLEDLVADLGLARYHDILAHLGLHGAFIPLALSIAYENSLFNHAKSHGKHVLSGKPARWKSELDDETLAIFEQEFPDALSILGYCEKARVSRPGIG